MIFKGTVIDINNNHAVVMTEQAEFYKIIKKNNMLKGMQIIFLQEDIYEDGFNINKVCRYAAVITILVFSLLLLSQFTTFNEIYYMPLAVVSVDINPSVELEINEDYKLINVSSKNDEGDFIIDKNLIGKDLDEALYMILSKAESENYITTDKNSVLIGYSIINDNAKVDLNNFENNLSKKLKNNNNLEYVNIVLLQGDKDKLQASKQNDLTIGKYLLYLNVNTEGELGIEEVKSMSTQELINFPKQYRNRNHGNDNGELKDNDINKEIEEKIINEKLEDEECSQQDNEEQKKYRHKKGKN